ncbi:rCG32167 [Rattus norvegicus]|uniref:RCG32167 n=1 Tax=Rattus norvegicus TaxID=10116 RepID=A6JX16_RAT|nr:rCG32167 [Rattus norvegicus]
MKQDAVGAVRSHNTVIFEDSTVWIFFFLSSLLSVSGLAYNEQKFRLCLSSLSPPTPHPHLYPAFMKVAIASEKKKTAGA